GAEGLFTVSVGDAYLFDLASRTQRVHLAAPDLVTGSHFGSSVAISGSNVLVGTDNDLGGTGAAYLFDAQTGAFERKLVPTDGFGGDEFGAFVAMSGNLAVISAISTNSHAGAV